MLGVSHSVLIIGEGYWGLTVGVGWGSWWAEEVVAGFGRGLGLLGLPGAV